MKKCLMVVAVPSANNRFAEALSITAKREEQINDTIDQCNDGNGTYPEILAAISGEMNNANELVFAAFHLGAYAGGLHAKERLLAQLLDDAG